MPKINYVIVFIISRLVLKRVRKFRWNPKLSLSLVLIAPLALSACNTLTTASDSEETGSAKATESAATGDTGNNDDSQAIKTGVTDKQVNLEGDELFNLLAAEFAGNSGDIETSLHYYEESAKTIDDSRIAARTAYIALYGKKYEEALVALDRWRELEPDSIDLPQMYAITYLKLGQPEKAVPYIQKILDSTHEKPVNVALAVKQLLEKEATPEDAYVVLDRLDKTGDNRVHLLILQSRYAAQLKNYNEAIALLDEALETDPSLNEVLIIKARILTAQGKNEEAARLIKQVLEEYPDNNALRMQYARMLVEQMNIEAAIEQYSILHENLPEDATVTLSLALLYIEAKQLDEASDTLQQLVEMDQKVSVSNYYLGRIAQNQGENKKAVAYYLRVNSDEYTFDAQLRIGLLLSMLGKTEEGLAKLESLAEDQVDWSLRVKAYLAQGEILRGEKRYKDGVEMYSRALQQKPDDTMLLYARGLMAEKIDRLDMAEADLKKVITIEPKNADALNALGYTLADRTTRYKEALGYIERASELAPGDPAILDSLGWVNYRLGKMDEAVKWLSMAFEKLEDAEIAAHYGEVLWYIGQKDKAREVWKKGKAQNADNPVLIETLKRINP